MQIWRGGGGRRRGDGGRRHRHAIRGDSIRGAGLTGAGQVIRRQEVLSSVVHGLGHGGCRAEALVIGLGHGDDKLTRVLIDNMVRNLNLLFIQLSPGERDLIVTKELGAWKLIITHPSGPESVLQCATMRRRDYDPDFPPVVQKIDGMKVVILAMALEHRSKRLARHISQWPMETGDRGADRLQSISMVWPYHTA